MKATNLAVTRRIISIVLVFLMVFAMVPGTSLTAFADEKDAISLDYGNFIFDKISNPAAGSKEADGINTNDVTGYPANRLNSYAWAVASRGDSIYIGTNRTLFGSALNSVAETMRQKNPAITDEMMGNIVTKLTGGDVPVNLKEEDYIPQIIRFDVKKGSTEVIYRPGTAVGEDGKLYYTDKDGVIIPNADVTSETASFRSVIQFNGNLYFGSLGGNMMQLVRVDENDKAEVVFQTNVTYSSLRAGCLHDAGEGETVYFGGQDTSYRMWHKYRQEHAGEPTPLPIVIRYLDPKTSGAAQEDWSGLVADFTDFGKYAYATVYQSGGGNVWDLCSYNGNLYLILAYDGGWVMFRGEKGGDAPNKFGWTWTEVVGDKGKYPMAMNAEIKNLNDQFAKAYGCSEYGQAMTGTGLLESTATPYVYNGKMYIGTFDNATMLQAQTVFKFMAKLQALKKAKETGNMGPSLAQIFAPFYESLYRPQHIYVMDEKERIVPVSNANKLLRGNTNSYVWRFVEYDGRLYTGTFDGATAFNYYIDFSLENFISVLQENRDDMPEYLQMLLDGGFSGNLQAAMQGGNGNSLRLSAIEDTEEKAAGDESSDERQEYEDAAMNAAESADAFFSGDGNVDELLDVMKELEAARADLQEAEKADDRGLKLSSTEGDSSSQAYGTADEMIDFLIKLLDSEGLEYWSKAKKLIRQDEHGFDLYVTEDGKDWTKVVDDGLNDPYNYGARTFTVCDGELYLGTANPYYGAQLWKVTCKDLSPATVVEEPAAAEGLTYNGSAQELVAPGKAEGGTMVYALGLNAETEPESGWEETVPTAVNAGTYTVFWKVRGDERHLDKTGGSITVKINKSKAKIKVKTTSKSYKAKQLKKRARKFSIRASVNSKGKLSYKVVKYKTKASKKYLKFNTKNGKITVKKGTPKGTYSVRVKVKAKATTNYKSASLAKTIKVKVK